MLVTVEVMYLSGERVEVVEFDSNDRVTSLLPILGLEGRKFAIQQITNVMINGVRKLNVIQLLPTDVIILDAETNRYELYIVFLEDPIKYIEIGNYWAMSWLCTHDNKSVYKYLITNKSDSYMIIYNIGKYILNKQKVDMIELLISIGFDNFCIKDLLLLRISKIYISNLIYNKYNNLSTFGLIKYLAKNDPDIEFANLFIKYQIRYEHEFESATKCGNFEFVDWISSISKISSRLYSMADIVRFSIGNPKYDDSLNWIEWASGRFEFRNVIEYVIKNEKKLRHSALEIIIRLIRVGCPITKYDMDNAIIYNTDIAAWLGDNGYSLGSKPINYYIATNNWDMVEAGTAKIIYPVTAQHFDNNSTMHIIATLPHLYNIELAKKVLDLGCTWGGYGLTTLARKHGNDDFAKWAREARCTIGPARAIPR